MSEADESVTIKAQRLPWQWLAAQVDLAAYRPMADPQVIAERIVERDSTHYVLKNPTAAYLKLDEADYNLWQLMDSSRTVKELVVAHFVQHKTFAFGRIAALVTELKDEGFLLDKPVGVFRQTAQRLDEADWTYRWRQMARSFIEHRFPVEGLDRRVTFLYNRGGRFFFNPVVLFLMLIVALVGFYPFVLMLLTPQQFPVVGIRGGGYWGGLILLLLANIVIIFFHELAHALTTKHYKREVPSGGAMIYYGMPAFYVNTMDIWLEPKRHRLAVSWAGPFSGLVLAGGFSLLAVWAVSSGNVILSQFLFKMAFLGYVGFLVNLNPLLELDGYFILMDALEIPMLRQRALHFIKTELAGKLKMLVPPKKPTPTQEEEAAFTREELIFTIYGVLTAFYTAYTLWFVIFLWNNRIIGLLADLWTQTGWIGRLLLSVLALAIFIPAGLALFITVWRGISSGFLRLHKRGFFEREQNIAILSALALIAVIGLPFLFPNRTVFVLPAWSIVWAAFAVWSLIVTARQFAGSEVQPRFWALMASASLMMGAALAIAFSNADAGLVLGQLAIFPLAVVGLTGIVGLDFKKISRAEQWVILILLLAGLGGVIVTARRATSDLDSFLAGGAFFFFMLFLAGVIPLLVAYRRTQFVVPWLLLTGGAVLLEIFARLTLSPQLGQTLLLAAIAFWAVGSFVYASVGWRVHLRARPFEQTFTLTEEERLRQAFIRFFETLFDGFKRVFGNRRAQSVDDDLDVIAVTANWDVVLDRGRVRDRLNLKKMTVLEQADRYQEILGRAIDLMDNWSGSRFITRAAQAAYDSLPWLERETLGRYVLAGTPWGGDIARQFVSALGTRVRLLRSLPLFAGASNEILDQVLAVAESETVSAGAILSKEGKPYSQFILVMGGEIETWKTQPATGASVLVAELRRGAAFGSPVFSAEGAISQATYRASIATEILRVSREQALQLLSKGLDLRVGNTKVSRLGQLLSDMPLFAELSLPQVETLLHRMGQQRIGKGEVIIRQGESRRLFYVIESGEVGVFVENAGKDKLVAKLGRGEHFGETALFTDQPYSATCVALTDVRLLTLDEFTFDRLVATSHQMTYYVEQVSSGRLKDTRRKLGQK